MPTRTIETDPAKIAAYLRRRDKVLGAAIKSIGPLEPHGPENPAHHFTTLARTIVGQQLSVLAAQSIYNRFTGYFGGKAPTPKMLLKVDAETLRAHAGLSRAKVSYLFSLAELTETGKLHLKKLDNMADDDVIAELTQVKGIGTWSAHMFLMFHLGRSDILAPGDLGLRKGMMQLYALPSLPDPAAMEEIAEPWRPYRTTGCRYLWRSLDMKPV